MKSNFSPLSFASLMPVAIMFATLVVLANTSRPLSGQERKLAKVSPTEAFKEMTSKPVDPKSLNAMLRQVFNAKSGRLMQPLTS